MRLLISSWVVAQSSDSVSAAVADVIIVMLPEH
jgi:hypothetical protein